MVTIGEIIKAARKQQHLTQKQLGEMCGYRGRSGEVSVQHWEHGRQQPPVELLRTLAKALGLTLEQLIP